VPGGSAKIREFEHGPRLCRSTTGFSEEQYEATRQRWVAAACQQLKERGLGHCVNATEAKEPFTFQRWMLGGNMFNDNWIREHPLVADGLCGGYRWTVAFRCSTRRAGEQQQRLKGAADSQRLKNCVVALVSGGAGSVC